MSKKYAIHPHKLKDLGDFLLILLKFELRNTMLHKVINNEKNIRLWLREIKNGFIVNKCNELIAEYRRLIEFSGDLSHFDAQMVREFAQGWKVHQNGLNYSVLFRCLLSNHIVCIFADYPYCMMCHESRIYL